MQAVEQLKKDGISVYALETTDRSVGHTAVSYPPQGAALILGNELTGVSPEVLEACDAILQIPTFGIKVTQSQVSPLFVADIQVMS